MIFVLSTVRPATLQSLSDRCGLACRSHRRFAQTRPALSGSWYLPASCCKRTAIPAAVHRRGTRASSRRDTAGSARGSGPRRSWPLPLGPGDPVAGQALAGAARHDQAAARVLLVIGQRCFDRLYLVRLRNIGYGADAFALAAGDDQPPIAGFPAGQADFDGVAIKIFLPIGQEREWATAASSIC